MVFLRLRRSKVKPTIDEDASVSEGVSSLFNEVDIAVNNNNI